MKKFTNKNRLYKFLFIFEPNSVLAKNKENSFVQASLLFFSRTQKTSKEREKKIDKTTYKAEKKKPARNLLFYSIYYVTLAILLLQEKEEKKLKMISFAIKLIHTQKTHTFLLLLFSNKRFHKKRCFKNTTI